jgi:hypothetical protein
MGELQHAILWNLLSLGGIECKPVDSKIIVNGFPDTHIKNAKKELRDLVERNYVQRRVPTNDEALKNPSIDLVAINPERYQDIKRMVNPDADPFIKEVKPIEDQIPDGYEERPFLTTKGSHMVRGVKDSYYFYRKTSDENYVSVFLISDGKLKNRIHIGSIYENNSLHRRTILGMDKKFRVIGFTKAQMRELGSDIVGNRQPVKALIDLLEYEGFIDKIDKTHYRRTEKQVPTARTLEKFMKKETKDKIKIFVKDEEKDHDNIR